MRRTLAVMCALGLVALGVFGAGAQWRATEPEAGYPAWVMDTIDVVGAFTVAETLWAPSGYRFAQLHLLRNGPGAADCETLRVGFTVSDTTGGNSCTDSLAVRGCMDASVPIASGGLIFPVSCVRITLNGMQATTISAHWAYIGYCIRSPGAGHGDVSWP